jgi:hypothetical protein
MVQEDGKTLPATENIVGPCNNALLSLFDTVTMKINDDLITTSNQLYPYRQDFKFVHGFS